MPFPPEALIFAPLIVLCGYTVLGVGGFGSALVSIPLLALVLPIKTVVPLMLLLDFVGMLTHGLRLRKDFDWGEAKLIIAPLLIGLSTGVTALVALPARALLGALGIFVLAYAIYSLRHRPHRRPISRWWAVPTGVIGGLLSGMFGTGGATLAMYYSARIPDLARMRGTMSAVFVVTTGSRLMLFVLAGLLLQREVWLGFAALVPLVFAGIFIGHRLHGVLTPLQVARIVSILLLFSGASLLVKALG